ncbi:hypothetical protein PUN28_005944 [Cardiocondyla obscurior]|uniref:Uncharacterized protein n=1 Tax=Cardiocondyla obscurior TaxID=286306 RepID=A0AAW2G8J2_9HYME
MNSIDRPQCFLNYLAIMMDNVETRETAARQHQNMAQYEKIHLQNLKKRLRMYLSPRDKKRRSEIPRGERKQMEKSCEHRDADIRARCSQSNDNCCSTKSITPSRDVVPILHRNIANLSSLPSRIPRLRARARSHDASQLRINPATRMTSFFFYFLLFLIFYFFSFLFFSFFFLFFFGFFT